ncbi:hypothetical protein B0H10DRAFT_1938359 [Mycena sp. CBHHK59/15]|nr:hypothetical protein B0H10DRAFT_1938359 [Mycena sp. CBHHK59/15]
MGFLQHWSLESNIVNRPAHPGWYISQSQKFCELAAMKWTKDPDALYIQLLSPLSQPTLPAHTRRSQNGNTVYLPDDSGWIAIHVLNELSCYLDCRKVCAASVPPSDTSASRGKVDRRKEKKTRFRCPGKRKREQPAHGDENLESRHADTQADGSAQKLRRSGVGAPNRKLVVAQQNSAAFESVTQFNVNFRGEDLECWGRHRRLDMTNWTTMGSGGRLEVPKHILSALVPVRIICDVHCNIANKECQGAVERTMAEGVAQNERQSGERGWGQDARPTSTECDVGRVGIASGLVLREGLNHSTTGGAWDACERKGKARGKVEQKKERRRWLTRPLARNLWGG